MTESSNVIMTILGVWLLGSSFGVLAPAHRQSPDLLEQSHGALGKGLVKSVTYMLSVAAVVILSVVLLVVCFGVGVVCSVVSFVWIVTGGGV